MRSTLPQCSCGKVYREFQRIFKGVIGMRVYTYIYMQDFGFPAIENQTDKNMRNEMETGMIYRVTGMDHVGSCTGSLLPLNERMLPKSM